MIKWVTIRALNQRETLTSSKSGTFCVQFTHMHVHFTHTAFLVCTVTLDPNTRGPIFSLHKQIWIVDTEQGYYRAAVTLSYITHVTYTVDIDRFLLEDTMLEYRAFMVTVKGVKLGK